VANFGGPLKNPRDDEVKRQMVAASGAPTRQQILQAGTLRGA
jgi:hypothetical protein